MGGASGRKQEVLFVDWGVTLLWIGSDRNRRVQLFIGSAAGVVGLILAAGPACMFRTCQVLCLCFQLVLVGSVVDREELHSIWTVLVSWTVAGFTDRSKPLVTKGTRSCNYGGLWVPADSARRGPE